MTTIENMRYDGGMEEQPPKVPVTIGLARQTQRTPSLEDQLDALRIRGGCYSAWGDIHPATEKREDMIIRALRKNDTVMVCGAYALGGGEKTALSVLERIAECGAKLTVLDGPDVDISTPKAREKAAKLAVAASRADNAKMLNLTRRSVGRKAKLDVLSDEEKRMLYWLCTEGEMRRTTAAEFCNLWLGCEGVTATNVSQWVLGQRPR